MKLEKYPKFFVGYRSILIILFLLSSLMASAQKQYDPTWESIDSRPTPEWFSDAKFGVFICWGLYSVPAWSPVGQYSEWYQYWLQEKKHNGQVTDFHNRTYGEDFLFEDFAPMFRAELFNADDWASMIKRAGAKYIVFTTKHHSGYTMWPSKEAEQSYGENYNPVKVGPKRDIVGELEKSMRKKDIKFGLYYSLYEWYHPLYKTDINRFVDEHFHPQFKDLVSRYSPDIIWTDGEWEKSSDIWKAPELLAWLFNDAPNKESLVINDRWGNDCRHKHGGFHTTEYGSGMNDDSHPWEESRGIGYSYGYNRAENIEDYRSAQELILMLVDLVSRGGNLCLDIGPAADGSIPVIMQERLYQVGEWLEINGEAIYGTRMWKQACQWSEGKQPEMKRGEYMSGFDILKQTIDPDQGNASKEIFFTSKSETVYAISPMWPGKELRIKSLQDNMANIITPTVNFLLSGQKLKCQWKDKDLIIEMPEYDPDSFRDQAAFVFRVGK